MRDESHPRTRDELLAAFDSLIRAAHANGVTVNDGAFTLRHDDSQTPDWEVHVTEISKGSERSE